MKTLITSESWHERAVAIGIIIATLIVLAILASTAHAHAAPVCPTPTPTTPPTAIRLQTFDAAPAAICSTHTWTCTQYRSTFGVRYCVSWLFRCAKSPHDAGKVAGLSQPVPGNLGGCAEGNKWRGLSCTINDFRPGSVSGVCDAGLWFQDVKTSRTFSLDQPVTVQGCEYENWQLASAPGWPIRISR
jgi:hypothetical protein